MKISKLKKSYGEFTLELDSFAPPENKVSGLIGPNGCGKSTLLKLIAGVLEPDCGSIDYEGLTPRDITMLPRKPYLLHDTVYKNLVYPLKLRGIAPERGRVDYWLELTGLYSKRRDYAPGLSGGQQQKLALARALIFSPRLILLDEGLSNMDLESIAMFERFIRERQKREPSTWLVVSHQLSHIERMCDYLYFMDEGQIRARGKTHEMLSSEENEALARFLRFEAIRMKGAPHDG